MKKNSMKLVLVLSLALALGGTLTSYAGEWKQDSVGWWYDYGYGTYPASEWLEINGKDYYFNEDGYMLHDTVQDGFSLGSDGARLINDIGLTVAPYKDYLDTCLNYPCTENGYGIEQNNWGEETVWVDCGDYYAIKDITLFTIFMDEYGADSTTIGSFDELYIRKDGKYTFDNKIVNLDDWQDTVGYLPRFGLIFDDKGYVVGFRDANVL